MTTPLVSLLLLTRNGAATLPRVPGVDSVADGDLSH